MFSVYSSSFRVRIVRCAWRSQFRVECHVRSSCVFDTHVLCSELISVSVQNAVSALQQSESQCVFGVFVLCSELSFSMVIINFFNKRNLSVYLLFGVFVLCSELSFQCSKLTSSCILSTRNYLQSF